MVKPAGLMSYGLSSVFVPFEVDAHQARRSDLLEHEAVRIDQEVVRAGHARRDVREHQIVPTEMRHEPIAGREVDARRPFLRRDLVANVAERVVDDPHLHKSPVTLAKPEAVARKRTAPAPPEQAGRLA